MPSRQEQLPSEPSDGQRGLLNSTPCFGSTAPSPLLSDDNFQEPAAATIPSSYTSAVRHGEASHERERANVQSQQPVASVARQEREWKRGYQGKEWRNFQPTHVDGKGRLHHGSLVRGAHKSVECCKHKSNDSSSSINYCTFAHSWKGDTCQSVCTKCTKENKPECKPKKEHEEFIWNLGPYITKEGKVWKGTDKKTSK